MSLRLRSLYSLTPAQLEQGRRNYERSYGACHFDAYFGSPTPENERRLAAWKRRMARKLQRSKAC
jgi:hypothetical protein